MTTLDRFGLVTWEGSEPMLRMLQVDELHRAMGFPRSHVFDRDTRRDKIRLLGNGVAPLVTKSIVETLLRT
jgi:DNA (cytosine-5)-methyltransferase 1